MHISKLTLTLAISALALGCVVNDDDATGSGTETNGTGDGSGSMTTPTATMTMSASNTNGQTGDTTEGPSTDTDPGTDSGTTAVDPGPFVADDPDPTLYTRVDFQGLPAVNTALIPCVDPDAGNCRKDDYNNATQAEISGSMFDSEVSSSIFFLADSLDDDLAAVPVPDCDTPDCVAFVDNFIEPDALTIDTAVASGFPSGRLLEDQVIDITLAAILLDIGGDPTLLGAFAGLPLNPVANDVAFGAEFPYLAPAN
jgi:hypothetical protein